MFVIIVIFSLLCCLEMNESSNNYQVHDGMNINSNVHPSTVISSMRKENHIFCLVACNLNQECLSTIYVESKTNDNCILYKKHFDSTETTTSSNAKLFIKNGKI